MLDATQTLERQILEMRWRCLSLAADLDRIQNCAGGADLIERDLRLQTFRRAVDVLLQPDAGRAERVQMLFSDLSAPPK